jgi:hypothetical protein
MTATAIAAAPRSWTVELPPGTPIITGNNRLHWAERNKRVKNIHEVVAQLAAAARLPLIGCPVTVVVEYATPPRLRAKQHPFASQAITDDDGIAPTGKAMLDALVRCGVLNGDTHKWVRGVRNQLADHTHPRGVVRITITEVT